MNKLTKQEHDAVKNLIIWDKQPIVGLTPRKWVYGQFLNNELGKQLFNDYDMITLHLDTMEFTINFDR